MSTPTITPTTSKRGGQTIAGLNQEHDPSTLSHYIRVEEMDEVILGVRKSTTALCGHVFRRSETDVSTYARARREGKQLCPVCHVLYTRRGQ